MEVKQPTDEAIRFDTIEEVQALPGYQFDIDPSTVKLDRIIGGYQLKEKTPCGLKGCHTPHFKGYAIVTVDDRVTNIGQDCGKKHFDADFEEEFLKFRRKEQRQARRKAVAGLIARKTQVLAEIEALLQGDLGVQAISNRMEQVLKALSQDVLNRLHQVGRRPDGLIMEEQPYSAGELRAFQLQDKKPDPPFKLVPVGRIDRAGAILAYRDMKRTLVREVKIPLEHIDEADLETMSDKDLARIAKWANETDQHIRQVKSLLEDCIRFLQSENLESLRLLARQDRDRRTVNRVLREFALADLRHNLDRHETVL